MATGACGKQVEWFHRLSLRLAPIGLTHIPAEVWPLYPLRVLPVLGHQDSAPPLVPASNFQTGHHNLRNDYTHECSRTTAYQNKCGCSLRVMVICLCYGGASLEGVSSPSFIGLYQLYNSVHLNHVGILTGIPPGLALCANLSLPLHKAGGSALPGH